MIACGNEEDVLYAGVLELLDGFDDVDDCAAGANADVAGFGIEVLFHCKLGGSAFGGFNGGEFGCSGIRRGGERGVGDGLWEVHCVWEKVRSR